MDVNETTVHHTRHEVDVSKIHRKTFTNEQNSYCKERYQKARTRDNV